MASDPLSKYAVGEIDSIYYIPDFVSPEEQKLLLHQVNSAPASKWKNLKNRRLQNWGGIVESKGLIQQPLPSWLVDVTQRISEKTKLYPAPMNHVLVNEYRAGQGILPHQDGPSYFPVVAILSLGAPTVMDFQPHLRLRESATDEQAAPGTCSLALLPGSLLIFKDSAYTDFLHGIDGAKAGRLDSATSVANLNVLPENYAECLDHYVHQCSTRVSLTCRYVPKLCRSFLRL